jgi:hypothetical protein
MMKGFLVLQLVGRNFGSEIATLLGAFVCLVVWLSSASAEPFLVRIISDETITILDPTDAGPDAVFHFEEQADGTRLHSISVNLPLGYRDCRVDYRRATSVRVRWEPPEDFSDFAAEEYDIILSIIEPSLPEQESVTIRLDTPEGFGRELLDQYEDLNDGDGLKSIGSFFTTALLARHFAHALPEGHGKTARMANASADHLVEANRFFSNVNLQPGWEYERFVEENAGSGQRAEVTMRALQGMNVSFFRDIDLAIQNIRTPEIKKCEAGLAVLRELSQCYNDISTVAPGLLPDVVSVLDRNNPDYADEEGFDFSARIAEAQRTCQALE